MDKKLICVKRQSELILAEMNCGAFSRQDLVSLAFAHHSVASSDCVKDNITNMSQVAFGEME